MPLSRAEVVVCALQQATEVRRARQELAGLMGQRQAAGTWLPDRPVASLALAERVPPGGTEGRVLNWYLSLVQEVEIAGQRSWRLEVADARLAAGLRRLAAAEREAAAGALSAYYTALAAQEEVHLGRELKAVGERLSALAVARAGQSLLSAVEADVAQAEGLRLGLVLPEAERRLGAAQAALGALLGLEALPRLAGSLDDLPPPPPEEDAEALVARALVLRGEPAAADAEARAQQAQVQLLRRARVPNLVLGFTAQRDGFDERVLGGSLALALPLPWPLGPSLAGEIAAARAAVAQAETERERVRRQVSWEVRSALAASRAYAEELRLYAPGLLQRAPLQLRALGEAWASGQLPLREALLWQRSLIEVLQAHVRTRLGVALGRVQLLRAAGLLP
ncbi:MAG: TolC family protein [Myxococcales bacterium]|nr:TolC family protein [Myxococcales bacterium]